MSNSSWLGSGALTMKPHRPVRLQANYFSLECVSKSKSVRLYKYKVVTVNTDHSSSNRESRVSVKNTLDQFLKLYCPVGNHEYVSPNQVSTDLLDLHSSIGGVHVSFSGSVPLDSQDLTPVFRWFLHRLTEFRGVSNRGSGQLQKVGRYFFDASSREEDRQTQVIGGFSASVGFLDQLGYYVHIDTLYRAVHRKNVLETVNSNIEIELWESGMESSLTQDKQSSRQQNEWRRRCENAVVVTLHNNRVYRIKSVRFDLSPDSTFCFKDKRARNMREMSYSDFYRRFYNRALYDMNQPLLEAYSQKSSETVMLVPELCSLTGLTEEMRKDRMLMQEVLHHSMVSTTDRMKQCIEIAKSLKNDCGNVLGEWNLEVSVQPAVVDARVLDPVEVNFGVKRYTVEDGNFQRWTRNGSHCPVQLTRWIVIYPDQDKPLVDMWLRSMRELGGSGFGMHFSDPMRFVCCNQPEELRSILMEQVTAEIQLVMLFTPQKDARRMYQTLKNITCTVRPCITQVVKSETMRKRQSIVAVVTRIVMQISAKLLGPLWHVGLDSGLTPMMKQPCMLVGIDVCQSKETRRPVLGFVASLDAFASHHFTDAVLLDAGTSGVDCERRSSLIAAKIKQCTKRALEAFAEHNDGILPTNIIFYRGSVPKTNLNAIGEIEVRSILAAITETSAETWTEATQPGGATKECPYEPSVTYVLCVSNVTARFFQSQTNSSELSSPQPGTVIESLASPSRLKNWYMVNQHVARGTAVPTQYFIAYDSSTFSIEQLMNLTYRLAHMYYNFPGSVRLPAPTQYARKLAHLVGTAIQAEIHPRLKETLFFL